MPLDQARFQLDLLAADRTAAAFASMDNRMRSSARLAQATAGGLSDGFGLAVGAATRLVPVLSAAAAAHAVWNAGMKAGNLPEQAEQIGLNAEQLQAYRLAAAQANVTNEQLDASMLSLTRAMGAANGGNDEMIARFERIGVKLLDANGQLRKVGDTAPEVARGLLAMGSETERNALMMNLLGGSGSRMVTILGELAKGNDAVIASARNHNAIVGGETSAAWNQVGSRLAVVQQQATTLFATLARPVAMGALTMLNAHLTAAAATMKMLQSGADWLTRSGGEALEGGSSESLIKRQETIKATLDVIKDSTDALDVAKVAGMRKELERISDVLAERATKRIVPPRDISLLPSLGAGNPLGDKAKGQASNVAEAADRKLDELRAEHAAVERGLRAFEVRGLETVAEADKRIAAQVALEKQISGLTANLPKDSPLAIQLAIEATALDASKRALDDRKRTMTDAEQVNRQYGDGQRELMRLQADYDRMLALGVISQDVHTAAMRRASQQTDDQARALAGAKGGFDAYIAGFDQGMVDLQRANSEFEIGRRGVDLLSESIDTLAGVSNRSFDQIALDFALMIAKMEAARAASMVWESIGGFAGILGFLGIGSYTGTAGATALYGSASSTMGSLTFGGPRAAGGPVDPGHWYMVGERGPEPFVPAGAGTIIPNSALRGGGGGGGGATIVIHQQNQVGQFVTQTEWRQGMNAAVQRAADMAVDRILGMRRDADPRIKALF